MVKYKDAKIIDAKNGDMTNVRLNLLRASIISGRISLPDSIAPAGEIRLSVIAEGGKYANPAEIIIPAGGSYADYRIPAVRCWKRKRLLPST